jgi:hypothetical protein
LTAAIWLIVVQWLSSALGGYLAGRTRARWNGLHTDESTFRDTAHGVLSWALATVITVSLVAGTAAAVVSGAFHATTIVAAAGAQGVGAEGMPQPVGQAANSMAYFADSLFRSSQPAPTSAQTVTSDVRSEGTRILLTEIGGNSLSDADKTYLTQLVASTTGLSAADAAKRVDDVSGQIAQAEAKARAAAEVARKSAAHAAFYLAFSMLIGAFIGGVAGALGGVHREHHAFITRRTV